MRNNNKPNAGTGKPRTALHKRRLALHLCRLEQRLLDVFCNTPASITPTFVAVMQTQYMQWRIETLLQKIYQESRTRWKEAYPDSPYRP
mgnify:FL=1